MGKGGKKDKGSAAAKAAARKERDAAKRAEAAAAAAARKEGAARGGWVQPRRFVSGTSAVAGAPRPSWPGAALESTRGAAAPAAERRPLVAARVQPGNLGGSAAMGAAGGAPAGTPASHGLGGAGKAGLLGGVGGHNQSRNSTPRTQRAAGGVCAPPAPAPAADGVRGSPQGSRAPPSRPRSACGCSSAAAMPDGAPTTTPDKGTGASASRGGAGGPPSLHSSPHSAPHHHHSPQVVVDLSAQEYPPPPGATSWDRERASANGAAATASALGGVSGAAFVPRRHAGRRSGEAAGPPPRATEPQQRAAPPGEDALSKLQLEPGSLGPSGACSLSGGQHALQQALHAHALMPPHSASGAHGYDPSAVRGAPAPPAAAASAPNGAVSHNAAGYMHARGAANTASINAFAEVVHARRHSSLDRAAVPTAGLGGGAVAAAAAAAATTATGHRPEGGSVPGARPTGATDFSSACGVSGFAEAVAAHLRGTRGDDLGLEAAGGAGSPYRARRVDGHSGLGGAAAAAAAAAGMAAGMGCALGSSPSMGGGAAGGVGHASGSSVAAQMILSSRELAAQLMERQMLATAAGAPMGLPSGHLLATKAINGGLGGAGLGGVGHGHGGIGGVSIGAGHTNGSSGGLGHHSGGEGGGLGAADARADAAPTCAPAGRTAASARAVGGVGSPAGSVHRPPPSLTHASGLTNAAAPNPPPPHPPARHEVEAMAEAMRRLPEGMSAAERAAQAAAISSAISSQLAMAAEAHHRRPPVETALRRRYTEAAFAASSQPHLQARPAKTAGLQYASTRPWPGGRH